jgi:phage gp45-like
MEGLAGAGANTSAALITTVVIEDQFFRMTGYIQGNTVFYAF